MVQTSGEGEQSGQYLWDLAHQNEWSKGNNEYNNNRVCQ